MVARGQTIAFADLQSLAALANQKLPGNAFRFLPELWTVKSQAEMLKLHCADRGDTEGGVAIRTDLGGAAFQLSTGGDFRQAGSWVPYSLPAVRRTWRQELNRIRSAIGGRMSVPKPANLGTFETDGADIYGPFAPVLIDQNAYTLNRFCFGAAADGTVRWPISALPRETGLLSDISVIPYSELEYISRDGSILSTQTNGQLLEFIPEDADYSVADLDYNGASGAHGPTATFKVRVVSPLPGLLSTASLSSAPNPKFGIRILFPFSAGAVTAPVISVGSGAGFFTMDPPVVNAGARRATIAFKVNTMAVAGTFDFEFSIQVALPWKFDGFAFSSLLGTGSPVLLLITATAESGPVDAIDGHVTPHSISIPTTIRTRVCSKLRALQPGRGSGGGTSTSYGIALSNLPNEDWYYEASRDVASGTLGTPFQIASSDNPAGFYRARLAFIDGAAYRESALTADVHGPFKLAPQAGQTILSADHKVTVGGTPSYLAGAMGANAIVVPRALFHEELDNPNTGPMVATGGGGTPQNVGSTVAQVVVRRRPVGSEVLWQKENPDPLTIFLGCIRNGHFHELAKVILGSGDNSLWEGRIHPDWPLTESITLAYQCDEGVDVQALLYSPISTNSFGPIPDILGNARPFVLADHYNNTFGLLQALPAP